MATKAEAEAGKRRAWWWHRQGLGGNLAGRSPAAVLKRSGWARSVGGVSPYLTLFARAGLGRSAVDAAVASLDIHELPSARGCTYVVPSSDFALGLLAGRGFDSDMATARKLGVTDREMDKLCDAVLLALARGPLEPAEIKQAVGKANRDLGEAGAKKGMASTLPLALGRLQTEGAIRRVPTTGRLDQQRYRYVRWSPAPLPKTVPAPEEVHTALAGRFFDWIGPARLSEFQWFSGLGAKAAKAAVAPLGLAAVDAAGEWLLHPHDVDAYSAFRAPADPEYALVGSLDAICALRRDLAGLLDQEGLHQKIAEARGTSDLGRLADLPSHAILDRGRVVGLWEFDTETNSIAWWSFGAKGKALEAAVARTEAFVRSDLGDARAFSLDSPKSRAPRIAALRARG
jgi:hypothetical protein